MSNFKKSKAPLILILSVMLLISMALTACSSGAASAGSDLKMHPVTQLPDHIRQAPVQVREAYQFAVANPDLIQAVPCYCGCAPAGHDSNYDCYVADVTASGEMIYDNHALGCTICVDITIDVMRMTADGEVIEDIRTVIDRTYSQYGPSNMAPVE
jgi:hypothetical protein